MFHFEKGDGWKECFDSARSNSNKALIGSGDQFFLCVGGVRDCTRFFSKTFFSHGNV